MEKKVNYIPEVRSIRQKKQVFIAGSVPNDMEQLNSLTKQISALTRLVSTVDEWKLEVMLSDEKYKGAVRIFSDKM